MTNFEPIRERESHLYRGWEENLAKFTSTRMRVILYAEQEMVQTKIYCFSKPRNYLGLFKDGDDKVNK